MEKRALIAVAISIAILVLYQEVVLRRFYPPPTTEGEEAVSETPAAEVAANRAPRESAPELPAPAPRPKLEAEARTITV
jgi:hypothetical protein